MLLYPALSISLIDETEMKKTPLSENCWANAASPPKTKGEHAAKHKEDECTNNHYDSACISIVGRVKNRIRKKRLKTRHMARV